MILVYFSVYYILVLDAAEYVPPRTLLHAMQPATSHKMLLI
jgi:hypothetical protein